MALYGRQRGIPSKFVRFCLSAGFGNYDTYNHGHPFTGTFWMIPDLEILRICIHHDRSRNFLDNSRCHNPQVLPTSGLVTELVYFIDSNHLSHWTFPELFLERLWDLGHTPLMITYLELITTFPIRSFQVMKFSSVTRTLFICILCSMYNIYINTSLTIIYPILCQFWLSGWPKIMHIHTYIYEYCISFQV